MDVWPPEHTTEEPTQQLGTHVVARGLQVRAGRMMAVNGLDLALGTGVHGLLGPNGAGKTTLMRALATVQQPAAGELALLRQPVHTRGDLREVRRQLGYLPQQFGYFARFSVRDFVEYMAWSKEVPAREIRRASAEAIAKVGLADRARSRMKTLSGGMLRRVGIAQAIVNRPAILLLDEPTVGLDPEQRMDFRRLLREIGAESCVVVSTHLVEDVAAACTDVALLSGGRVLFGGTVADLEAAGTAADGGDTPVERGYSAVLRTHRERSDVA
jgi:ABC-type multidrug transport system ATPase subunit